MNGPSSHDLNSLLAAGVEQLQAGQLDDAEARFREALAIKSDDADALHLLGLVRHQSGHTEEAIELIQKAVDQAPSNVGFLNNLGLMRYAAGQPGEALECFRKIVEISPDVPEVHLSLGNALKDLADTEDAIAAYRQALALKADYPEAFFNLADAQHSTGGLEEALESYDQALTLKPDFPQAVCNRGNVLKDMGRLEDAVESYRTFIARWPDFVRAEAHVNLGDMLRDLGRMEEAIESYRQALTLNSEFAPAHHNLGNGLRELGNLDEAFECHQRAIAITPENDLFWAGFARSLETVSFSSVDDKLIQDLLHLLERPTVRSSYTTQPIISALHHHPDFSRIVELTGSGYPEIDIPYGDFAGQLSAIPLFLRILGLNPIGDLEIERMLTVLRRAMLKETMDGNRDEKDLPFSTALALQCFTNEYIFSETDEEKDAVEQLQQQVKALVEKGLDVPPSLVATLGAYRPLHRFSWARELSERQWAGDIRDVMERQISEPLEEQSLRSQIPCLTAIENAVSQSVREQYEENPYPRWVKTGIREKGMDIGTVLRGAPLRFDLGDYQSPESPDILVAGCGTGQHSLVTVSRFSNARVLAVDLSLSSLSYALRKTQELDVSNIEYAQADIIELGSLGRQFDLIESVGVLHHLGDPLAGWRVLVDLLRPGGLMKIGLYSETARQHIISGRSLIAEKGYSTSAEDIRECRQDIMAMAGDGNQVMEMLCSGNNFFSLSECRDLLFHVQEHRFSLPQIEEALKALNLKFLGFGVRGHRALRMFRESHPEKRALTSLAKWHEFELDNPDTFAGMYQFWCKKM